MEKKYRKNCVRCQGSGIAQPDPIDVENGMIPKTTECYCWENIKQNNRQKVIK